jgi:ADP-ribosylation factor GTPase-activating protein 1
MGALSKGWSIFSGAVAGAGKTVNENILQPGMERVRAEAPGVQQRLGVFAGEAGKKLGEVHGVVKDKTGMDVQESWGALMGKMRDLNMGPNPTRQGYQGVGNDGWVDHTDETSALYRDDDGAEGEDFFDKFEKPKASEPTTSSTEGNASAKPAKHVEKEGWDDWKEF